MLTSLIWLTSTRWLTLVDFLVDFLKPLANIGFLGFSLQ